MTEKKMRRGITTGTCAAAAAKAALYAYFGEHKTIVEIETPQGHTLFVPVAASEKTFSGGRASVVKDAGDDPDITNGVTIYTDVTLLPSAEIVIKAGPGVGTVTKPGLSVAVGQPAINPGPQTMIKKAVRDLLPEDQGACVTVSIPGGEALAARTLNPILGIAGGLSVIGTTGIVEPMSEEAFKNSLVPQMQVVKALGKPHLIFVPGKIGQDIAVRCNLPQDATVQTSNFIGFMLEKAVELEFKSVLLFGHLGKLVKVAAGIFHTHNRMADARMETIAAYAGAAGASQAIIREILQCNTTEAAIPILEKQGLHSLYPLLAQKASERAMQYVFGDLTVGTVIVTMRGEVLGYDQTAKQIGDSLGWNIKS
ncbi:cobalt-precorrin-5B (C(1))-methyltransferase CbiD [Acetonema longum]|uniref:Cobalt-precorrin-5B C(1)-methyltransferase n=1 Tax=Acetonema longum DSM 6540 TaxID=1009370 RepID=F7NPW7_9FIRM|nr:cobalt-precorrin-5B (C(1))-methyltransferase CbiD [Acetonema longum]EGO61958.1 cobalt-precorrin-6A synthase [Acetonema longum DSM 6540]